MSVDNINSSINLKSNVQYNTGTNITSNVQFGKSEPVSDEFVSNAPKKNKNKWLLWAGIGIAAVATAIISIRHFSPLKQIERRFKKLYDDIPGTQKKFKEVFMREDLTEEETINMLKRYEKIEKDGLKQSKEEYWQAVFEEAKNNFNFDNDYKDIKLIIDKKIQRSTAGFWHKEDKTVHIRPGIRKKFGLGCIHHELRHAKQSEMLKYCTEDDLINIYGKRTYEDFKKNFPNIVKNQTEEEFLSEILYGNDSFSESIRKSIKKVYTNLTGRNEYLSAEEISKISKEKLEMSRKFLQNTIDYKSSENDFLAYWNNFIEQDARATENTINEMLTGVNTKYREKLFNIKFIKKLFE